MPGDSPSQQVVGRGGEGEDPGHSVSAAVAGFAQMTNSLQSPENFLQPFAQALAEGVRGVPGGAVIRAEYLRFRAKQASTLIVHWLVGGMIVQISGNQEML